MKTSKFTIIITRLGFAVLAAAALASCQSAPVASAPAPGTKVLYSAPRALAHTNPPGGSAAPWKTQRTQEDLASRVLHPVAKGLAIAGRTALFPIAIAASVYGAPNSTDSIFTEPLP